MIEHNNKESFEDRLLVYGAYLQVGSALQYSNRIQLRYKAITSTWLMATFIGSGYVLSSVEVNLPLHPFLVVPILCFASTFIILLIWYLDLIVQEKAIASAIFTGVELENEHDWLPQVYNVVLNYNMPLNYITMKSSFYLGVITIQSIAITSSLGVYLYLRNHLLWIIFSAFALLIVPGFFLLFSLLVRKTNPYPKLKNGN